MNSKTERLWLDMMEGMRNRAKYKFNDTDRAGRNQNWYARQVYGETYANLKSEFQRQTMNDIEEGTLRKTYENK